MGLKELLGVAGSWGHGGVRSELRVKDIINFMEH